MAKKKDSIALFEVMGKDKHQAGPSVPSVPGWQSRKAAQPASPDEAAPLLAGAMQAQGPAAEPFGPAVAAQQPKVPQPNMAVTPAAEATAAAAPVEPAESAESLTTPTAAPAATVPTPTAQPAAATSFAGLYTTAAAKESVLTIVGQHIRVTLSSMGWAVVAGGLAVVLVGVFFLGRWTAAPHGVAPAGGGGGDSGLTNGTLPPGPDAARQVVGASATTQDATGRQPGKYYLVIENLGTGAQAKKAGEEIIPLLASLDPPVPADLAVWKGDYILWSRKPFAAPEGKDNDEFVKKIEEIGAKLKPHNYFFRPNPKTGKGTFRQYVPRPDGH